MRILALSIGLFLVAIPDVGAGVLVVGEGGAVAGAESFPMLPERCLEAGICFVPRLDLGRLGSPEAHIPSVFGRSYAHTRAVGPGLVEPMPRPAAAARFAADESGTFDLWSIAPQGPADWRGGAIALTFSLSAKRARRVYLGLGNSDECLVVLNGVGRFACLGSRDRRRDQDLVPLDLVAGTNELVLLTQKKSPWTAIPADHYSDEWAVEARLHGSAAAAWTARTQCIFHPLDTPIVGSVDALRVEGYTDGFDEVALWDQQGRRVATGRARGDGSVAWEQAPSDGAFVGWLSLGGDSVEPVIVADAATLDTLAAAAVEQPGPDPVRQAWRFRVRHLLKPEYVGSRDRWWARKLALAVLMASAERTEPEVAALLERCEVARIEFRTFQSRIDRTEQFYRVYRPATAVAGGPVAIVLPAAPDPVRSYLESYPVADLSETEYLASAAKEAGLTLVWPGYVDVDYGGALAVANLGECLDALAGDAALRGGRFLVGFCSAGVAALNTAVHEPRVDGLVLCTPVVQRNRSRWFKGVVVDEVRYPQRALARDDWVPNWSRLAALPTFVVFDAEVPGHGDPAGTRSLLRQIGPRCRQLEVYWPENPDRVLVWGMRARDRALRWMKWIKARQNGVAPLIGPKADPEVLTVKEALLRGYRIEAPVAGLEAYRGWWEDQQAVYRGAKPSGNRAEGEAPTALVFRDATEADLTAMATGSWAGGSWALGPAALEGAVLDARSAVFALRLSQRDGKRIVEVVRSPGAPEAFPKIDLLVDGNCTGAVWLGTGAGWELFGTGVP